MGTRSRKPKKPAVKTASKVEPVVAKKPEVVKPLPADPRRKEYVMAYREHYRLNGKGASGVGLGSKPELMQEAGYKDGMSVLDFGCGWGALSEAVSSKDYLGVDITQEAINLATDTFPDREFKLLEPGTLKTTPKDFAVAFSVFTHALKGDVPACLRDITTNLKADGRAILDILVGDDVGNIHFRYWDKAEFVKELVNAGFEVERDFEKSWGNGFTHTYFVLRKK